jgi:excisionase family DNA binding protein
LNCSGRATLELTSESELVIFPQRHWNAVRPQKAHVSPAQLGFALQAATVVTAHAKVRKPESFITMRSSVSSSSFKSSSPASLPASDHRDLLTLASAAQRLSISKRTLERLISSGAFPPPVKIGRSSRVPRSDLSRYLDQLCRERGDKIDAS